jgi:hypothetical protein
MNAVRLASATLLICAPLAAAAQVPLPPPRPFTAAVASPPAGAAHVPLPVPRPPIRYASLVMSPRMRVDPPASLPVQNAASCSARDFSGQMVPVRHRTGASKFFAHANWEIGQPTITYGRAYFGLSPVMQRFASLHECGHLVLRTYDEFRANCHALRYGNWSAEELSHIRNFHERLGAMPANYGGSGPGFWRSTLRACPEMGAH